MAQAPKADRLNPTVECNAMVAPRKRGSAAIVIPEVSAPESAGTVKAYASSNGSSSQGELSAKNPIRSATRAELNITNVIARWR
jgi:hypothetical protein